MMSPRKGAYCLDDRLSVWIMGREYEGVEVFNRLLQMTFVAFFLTLSTFALADKAAIVEGLRAKKFILSIGIGQFENPVWHPLRFARKDAEDMFRYFKNGEAAFDGGELLIDKGQQVTPLSISRAFERLEQDNRNDDDVVIVYVSTHGTVAYKEEGKIGRYIITSQTDPKNMKATALDYDQLMQMFQGLKSRKKVLILAFCHSGVGKSILTPEMKRALAQLKSPYFEEPIQERSEGSIVLTASGWREPALEDERLQNDVYTHFLLDGFNKDRNNDGAVSITEAHAFASQATFEYTNGRQRPSAIMELLGSDPVIVSGSVKKKEKTASLFSLMDRFSKLSVTLDGKDYGPVEKGLIVPEGDVRLTVRDPDNQKVLADRVVNFQAGREYSIAQFLLPRLPHSLLLGVSVQQFLNDDVSRSFAPSAMQGFSMRYTFQEALGLTDLSAALSYFPEAQEQFELKMEDGQLKRFNQKRMMVEALLEGSRRMPVNVLSSSDRIVRTEARLGLGLTNLSITRDPEEAAFFQQKRFVSTVGLSASSGLETTWAYHLLRAGAEVRLETLRNFTSIGGALVLAPQFTVYLGSFW